MLRQPGTIVFQEYFCYSSGMARPKKDPQLLKNVDLRIPVTAAQKQLVMDATAGQGAEFAAWAREVLLQAASEQIGKSARKGRKAPKK
jgi:hypothetical protein